MIAIICAIVLLTGSQIRSAERAPEPLSRSEDPSALPDILPASRWARPPTPMNHFVVPRYVDLGVYEAITLCEVLVTGRLTNCSVIMETNRGVGLGRAALRAARDAEVVVSADLQPGAKIAFLTTLTLD